MYFPMELKHNPAEKDDIDAERERREEILGELLDSMKDSTMCDAGHLGDSGDIEGGKREDKIGLSCLNQR